MSQWNNSYGYNNQYQNPNNWNGDMNGQFINQAYFARPEGGSQYVSFNEFLNQMQTNNAVSSNSNYSNVQYENYPTQQYSYQNIPSVSQTQLNNYNFTSAPTNMTNEVNTYQMNAQSHYNPQPDSNTYTNEMVLNSNLTPTATEFVPKSSIPQPSTSIQHIPEASSSQNIATEPQTTHQKKPGGSSSYKNWRERPQNSPPRDTKEKSVVNGYSHENGKNHGSNNQKRDTYHRNNEVNGKHYENKHQDTNNRLSDKSPGLSQESRSNNEPSTYESSHDLSSESNSRNSESSSRNQEFNNRNQDTHSRYNDNSSQNPSNKHYEPNNRNREYNRNQEPNSRSQDSSSRNVDPNSRNEKRNLAKGNAKFKGKDSDNRTFYNRSMLRDHETQDVRGESSGRNRNFVGSQRLRGSDRNVTEDEQYASSYMPQKEMRMEKDKPRVQNVYSPVRPKNKQHGDQVNKEMTQRERLTEQLDKGALECLVCCDRVKQMDPVWSCSNCYHVLHLRCIRKWAMSSMVEGSWRCPACQNSNASIPTEYRCMCGAVRAPEYQRGSCGAHTCGRSCRRPRACPHPCTLLCHPGPCPPCQATISKQCGCGVETRSVLCSSKLPQVCGRMCNRLLECGAHTCTKECHEGPCDTCTEMVEQVCYCPAGSRRSVRCAAVAGERVRWGCGGACARVLACGAHVCRASCHAPPCRACALLPDNVHTCPCGKLKLDPEARKSCTDPIPLCGGVCAKPLPCGPAGDKHFCKLDCHEGPCPTCPEKTLVQCRCGHSSREVPCAELPEMINNVFCQKKCNKKLSCGRHRCRTTCCAASSHQCSAPCGRSLPCGAHRCENFCHTGRCPPCVVLTTKRCYGDHEERKTIPCSQEEFSCGLPCGKPLPCGKHTCIKTCHKGPCDTGKCTQPCLEKRPTCGHPCAAPCHAGAGEGAAACPSAAPCRRTVRALCPCGRRSADRTCNDNARDYAKMMSALAATKMQEGGSVDLSDVQRPGNMLKTLECDDECRVEARTRQLALALQIRNPDVSAKLAPRYNETLRAAAVKDPAFAQQIHDALTDLVQRAKKSKQKTRSHSFPSMNWQKRQFIHELSEHFGCESVAYDAEPNRNVVATADKEKSWLPAMSVLEVVSREAGRRRVPGPVLRAPPNAAQNAATTLKSAGGWATLTSSNAWAARSQPKPPPTEDKIDYFDNPPDN